MEPYIEEYARSRRIRVGQRAHTHFVEIYSQGTTSATIDEHFRLYGVQAITKARRAEASKE